jgi:hypothetical protein
LGRFENSLFPNFSPEIVGNFFPFPFFTLPLFPKGKELCNSAIWELNGNMGKEIPQNFLPFKGKLI